MDKIICFSYKKTFPHYVQLRRKVIHTVSVMIPTKIYFDFGVIFIIDFYLFLVSVTHIKFS